MFLVVVAFPPTSCFFVPLIYFFVYFTVERIDGSCSAVSIPINKNTRKENFDTLQEPGDMLVVVLAGELLLLSIMRTEDGVAA